MVTVETNCKGDGWLHGYPAQRIGLERAFVQQCRAGFLAILHLLRHFCDCRRVSHFDEISSGKDFFAVPGNLCTAVLL